LAQLGDSVVLLERGHVLAAGPLADIAGRADLPLGQRDDAGAVLVCRVAEQDGDRVLTRLEGGGISLWVPNLDAELGAECRVRIPAKEVILAARVPEAISLHNIIPGTVRGLKHGPARRSVLVEIAVADGVLLSRVTPDAVTRLGLEPGRPVLSLIKSTSIDVLGA
jgi:molybdate transport system ATP-binding protein